MTPGFRGYYEGTDGSEFIQIPRNCDPEIDGTSLASHRSRIFSTDEASDSVSLAEFDRRLEEAIPANVLARMGAVMRKGEFLATLGLADTPPLELSEWRRGMILSWSHARDLATILDALGLPRPTANRHDVDEIVLAKHLKERLGSADQWYLDYVNSLDDGAWINVGFFNPHLSASMYKWGDSKQGKQNAMDAHRLSAHHLGNAENPVDWVERAANFVIHHIPREHYGIRHEPRGDFSKLEERMSQDNAIKSSEIGKAIARDTVILCDSLEKEGKIVPWYLLNVKEDDLHPSLVEHAFLLISSDGMTPSDINEQQEYLDQLARAEAVIAKLPKAAEMAESAGRKDLALTYRKWMKYAGS